MPRCREIPCGLDLAPQQIAALCASTHITPESPSTGVTDPIHASFACARRCTASSELESRGRSSSSKWRPRESTTDHERAGGKHVSPSARTRRTVSSRSAAASMLRSVRKKFWMPSRMSTPLCARVTSPGRTGRPPPSKVDALVYGRARRHGLSPARARSIESPQIEAM